MTARLSRIGILCAGALAVLAGACSTPESPRQPFLPDKTVELTRSIRISLEALAVGALVWAALDPLAPNWSIRRESMDGNRVRIVLRRRYLSSGGDGEAAQLFRREAERVAAAAGVGGYTVLEYSEGIDSKYPLAQRVCEGVILLAASSPR